MTDLFEVKIPEYEQHEAASFVPAPTKQEYEELKKDIRKNGQLIPIQLFESKILDGWTRYKICKELGIQPRFEEVNPDDPMDYCLSLNINRRHLTTGQKADLGVKIYAVYKDRLEQRRLSNLKQGNKIPEGNAVAFGKPLEIPSLRQIAQRLTTSSKAIAVQEKLKELAPELAARVASGRTSMSHARQELQKVEQKELNGKVAQEKWDTIKNHGHKLLFSRLIGDYAEKRANPFKDESENEINAWIGCPEGGFMLEVIRKGKKLVVKLSLTGTGLEGWTDLKDTLYENVIELEGTYNVIEKEMDLPWQDDLNN